MKFYRYIARGSIHRHHWIMSGRTRGRNGNMLLWCLPCDVEFIGVGRLLRKIKYFWRKR